ncbi:MAG: hypothetical protein MI806_07360 [Minwuiales bacterium]|nr:hypothetical protein [Minwuiales bacterium]
MPGFSSVGELAVGELRPDLVTPSNEETFFFSNVGFTSGPDDTPANTYFAPRILRSLRFARSIVGSEGFGGRGVVNVGSAVLQGGDRGLDFLATGYDASMRGIEFRLGARRIPNQPDFAYDDFRCIFRGLIAGWAGGSKELRLRLRDLTGRLVEPVAQNRYTASDGPDLAGKPIPIALGSVFNVPLVAVDRANNVWQGHDGAWRKMRGFRAVRDRGKELDKVVGVPAIGEYSEDVDAGTVTLGGTPAGVLTADIDGAEIDGAFPNTVGDIARVICRDLLNMPDADLALDTFEGLAKNVTAPVGIWTGLDDVLAIDLIEQLMVGIGGFVIGSAMGQVAVGEFAPPNPSPSFTLDHTQIWDVERVDPPAAVDPALSSVRMGWGRNYRPLTETEMDPSDLTDDERQALSQEFREVVRTDTARKIAIAGARETALIPTAFADAGNTEFFADRRLDLYDGERAPFRFKTGLVGFGLDINVSGFVTHPEFAELKAGRALRIYAHDPNPDNGVVTVEAYG